MRLHTTLTLWTLFSFTALAQNIPSGSFDTWTDFEIIQPESWLFSGNAERTTDASNGQYAVKLENKAGQEVEVGVLSNAIITAGFTGGEAYSDGPLVMRFDVKYDIYPGDAARVYAVFQKNGQAIGLVDAEITGSSADTFATYKIPIQWYVSTLPDSVIVMVVSNDFDNESVLGDGYIIVDNIVLETFSDPDDQLINTDFENWEIEKISHPESWYTTDIFLKQAIGAFVEAESVVKTTDSKTGNAILLQNQVLNGEIFPGVALTGNALGEDPRPSFPVAKKWKFIDGYYKFDKEETDEAHVLTIHYKEGIPIGSSEFIITNSVSEYTYFSSSITFEGGEIPDSATVAISTIDLDGDATGSTTKLWIDDIRFTDNLASVERRDMAIRLYPNPVLNYVHIRDLTPNSNIQILNNLGLILLETSDNQIDVSQLPQGSYIIQISDEDSFRTAKFLKQ